MDIAVDGEGNAYVTGTTNSVDYPTTDGAFDRTFDTTFNGTTDAFVSKLNASGSALDNSTFLGGAGFDQGNGIAVDGEGSAYVTGGTKSSGFPTTPPEAFDTTLGGVQDAFVTKLLYGDFTPPTINVPTDITVDATSPGGEVVTYEVTVTDDVDANPTLSCDPASGSTFPIGTTTVECTATDSSGNSANASFNVVVRGAAEQISTLKETVTNLGLRTSLNRSLQAKLDEALAHLNAGRTGPACSKLSDFNSQVRAQSGKEIDPGDAEILITDANRIKAVLGCK